MSHRTPRPRSDPPAGPAWSPSRREVLAALGAGVALAALPLSCRRPASPAEDASLHDPIYYSSVRALASAIRRGDVSSEEVVRACLDRIAAVDGTLNAVVQIAADRAIGAARAADAALARGEDTGLLHGVPMTIKDSLDTAGVVTTGGTQGRRSYVPDRDATVVARLRAAGAILLGKTNTPELTLSYETDNLIHGRTNNPWDPDRSPGGSSGGAAAIVAAGGAPFDIGSDYGGSIRVPAHFCGIAGIKPSAGRVPRTGHILPFGGIQDSFQQLGPMARWVDDLILLLPIIAGPDGVDPGVAAMPWYDPEDLGLASLRVSFHSDNGIMTPTPETIRTVEAVAGALEPVVGLVAEARPPGIEDSVEIGLGISRWDGGASVERLLRRAGTTEHTLHGHVSGRPVPADQLGRRIEAWYAFRSRMLSFMDAFDAIACPVNAMPAMHHGMAMEHFPAFSYALTYNVLGWPATVVRAGTSPEGLPIGVQVAAAPGREDVTLAIARFLEAETVGFSPPPL